MKHRRIQYYPTEYEKKLIDSHRERTGESEGAFSKRVVRLYITGKLVEVNE